MGLKDLFKRNKRGISFQWVGGDDFNGFITCGYTPLSKNPEVIAGARRIAELVSSMPIWLKANTEQGDIRIQNELSKKIDIYPNKNMTRKTWMESIVMNMLVYGNGNAVVFPHTSNGFLGSLEPMAANRVSFMDLPGQNDYRILIDGKQYDPQDLLHFVYNPDENYMYKGQGIRVALSDVVQNLAQAQATTKGFMSNKYKPSVIIKVDALSGNLAGKEGRDKIMSEYIETSEAGKPWIIPSGLMEVEQIKPLTLNDLAIADTITLDKKTVAAILGVPSFVLGVGEYSDVEWNCFVNNTIRPFAQSIEQELTQKLIISDKWYLEFNYKKLYSYDMKTTAETFGSLYTKGIVTGNEVRNQLGLEPKDKLDDLILLENYIKLEDISNQLKLKQE